MPNTYTADELITSIRNLGMVPETGTDGSENADILRHINEEISLTLVPYLLRTRQDYLTITTRQSITGTATKFRLPDRAIGNALRFIRWVDSNGDRDQTPLEEVSFSHLHEYEWSTTDKPSGYYLEGDYVCLIGSSFSGSLELSWHFRPGELVLATNARQITNVNSKTITCASNLPTTWSTANTFDVHSSKSGAEIKVWSEAASAVGGSGLEDKITFANNIDGTTFGTRAVAVGDWVCLAEEAAIPALPKDLHPLIVRCIAVRMAESKGDASMVQVESALLEKAKANVAPVTSHRAGNTPKLKGCGGILWKMR